MNYCLFTEYILTSARNVTCATKLRSLLWGIQQCFKNKKNRRIYGKAAETNQDALLWDTYFTTTWRRTTAEWFPLNKQPHNRTPATTDGAVESVPEGSSVRNVHMMHGAACWSRGDYARARLRHVCVSTRSRDLHLQIKNNILEWTPGTDSENKKFKKKNEVWTSIESNIELHFWTRTCPHRLQ